LSVALPGNIFARIDWALHVERPVSASCRDLQAGSLCSPIRAIRHIRGSFPVYRFNGLTLQRFNDLTWRSHFPRNLGSNFGQYTCERPEMDFSE